MLQLIRKRLQFICPLLFECCKFTDYDKELLPDATENSEESGFFTTLRKSAGFTIERFSKIYLDDVFHILREDLETALKSQQVELIEPAVFVLGAISQQDGAYSSIQIHLQNLVPYLMEMVKSNSELLRSTTLWTLSQFTKWISKDKAILEEYVTILCQRMVDHDQSVQEQACCAFTEMIEVVRPDRLVPLLNNPLNTITLIINQYTGNALGILLDLIGQMAVHLREFLRSQQAELVRG